MNGNEINENKMWKKKSNLKKMDDFIYYPPFITHFGEGGHFIYTKLPLTADR